MNEDLEPSGPANAAAAVVVKDELAPKRRP